MTPRDTFLALKATLDKGSLTPVELLTILRTLWDYLDGQYDKTLPR